MVNPRAALSDVAAAIGGDTRRDRILGLTLDVLVTTIILIIFFVDAKINTAPPPRVTYVETYAPDRTDADIVASQKLDSAERKAFREKKMREFQAIQKRFNKQLNIYDVQSVLAGYVLG